MQILPVRRAVFKQHSHNDVTIAQLSRNSATVAIFVLMSYAFTIVRVVRGGNEYEHVVWVVHDALASKDYSRDIQGGPKYSLSESGEHL